MGVLLCKEALSCHDAEHPHRQPRKAFSGKGCKAAPWHTTMLLARCPVTLPLSPTSALWGERSPLCPRQCSRVGIVGPCHVPAPCCAGRELLGAGLERGWSGAFASVATASFPLPWLQDGLCEVEGSWCAREDKNRHRPQPQPPAGPLREGPHSYQEDGEWELLAELGAWGQAITGGSAPLLAGAGSTESGAGCRR